MALSLTGRRWRVHDDLRASVGSIDQLLARLVQERGLSDGKTGLSSVNLLPDLPRAIDRIWEAVDRHESVTVFGDYDCDGITSAAQMARFFRRHGAEPRVRLPHRLREGYGLKPHHITECADAGTTLLITVDTGISALDEVRLARQRGIDVIIIDHHHLREELPDGALLLHPALSLAYPHPYPAASGLTSLVVAALEAARGNIEWEDRQTDRALAALGTVADLVELRGENRTIVEQGLAAFATIGGPLALLKEAAGLTGVITSRDLAFRLAPRINAAGRMESPDIALAALQGDLTALHHLEELNRERQERVRALWNELQPRIDREAPMLFATSEQYTPGIVGLLAGKLTEAFGRPSFVGSITDGICVASLRSIPGYHVTEGLARYADLLGHFGGHAQAAGASLSADAVPELTTRMCEDVLQYVRVEELIPTLDVDAIVSASQISDALCQGVRSLEPFGQGNPEPRFLLHNISLTEARGVGGNGAHLQARIAGHKLIGFGLGSLLKNTDQPLDVVCRMGFETFRGRTALQLFVDDLRIAAGEQQIPTNIQQNNYSLTTDH